MVAGTCPSTLITQMVSVVFHRLAYKGNQGLSAVAHDTYKELETQIRISIIIIMRTVMTKLLLKIATKYFKNTEIRSITSIITQILDRGPIRIHNKI